MVSYEAINCRHKICERVQEQERNYFLALLKLMNDRVYCLVAIELQ